MTGREWKLLFLLAFVLVVYGKEAKRNFVRFYHLPQVQYELYCIKWKNRPYSNTKEPRIKIWQAKGGNTHMYEGTISTATIKK